MRPSALQVLIVVGFVSSCCGGQLHYDNLGDKLVHFDEFKVLPLREKMAAYGLASRRNCIKAEYFPMLLSAIADHGLEAADALTESLRVQGDDFPGHDAILILEYIHFEVADLRHHQALEALDHVARTAKDASLRKEANIAAERIRRDDVYFGYSGPRLRCPGRQHQQP